MGKYIKAVTRKLDVQRSDGTLIGIAETPVPFQVPNSVVNINELSWDVKADSTLNINVVDSNGDPMLTERDGNNLVVFRDGDFIINVPEGNYNIENSINIQSDTFAKTASYSDTSYAYYLLEKNTSDKFQNFVNGEKFNGADFHKDGNLRMLKLDGVNQYFAANTNDARGLVGNNGKSDYTVGIWVKLENLPSEDKWVWIAESSNGEKTGLKYDKTLNEYVFVRGSAEVATGVQVEVNKLDRIYCRFNWSSSGLMEIFLDGVSVNQNFSQVSLDYTATSEPILIGTDNNQTTFLEGYVSHFRTASIILPNEEIENLSYYRDYSIHLTKVSDQTLYVVPDVWVSPIKDDILAFTIPSNMDLGEYKITVYDESGVESNSRTRNISEIELMPDFVEDLSDINQFKERFVALHKQWGGENGGVVEENVKIDNIGGENVLVLNANGDNYNGSIQGVDKNGDPAFDGLGNPIVKRVGGCIVGRNYTGFGSFEFTAKAATELGVATAFWNFHYQEVYEGDPRWDRYTSDYIVSGTPQAGLKSQFNFEEDKTDNIAGSDTTNMVLTDQPNVTFNQGIKEVPSTMGKSLRYNGSEGYAIDILDSSFVEDLNTSFAFSFHIKVNTDAQTSKRHNIISQGSGKSSIGIQAHYLANEVGFQAGIRTESDASIIIDNNTGNYGEWHHLVLSYDTDDVGKEVKLYMNGNLAQELPKPSGVFNFKSWIRVFQNQAFSGSAAGFSVKDMEITDLRIIIGKSLSLKEARILYGRPYEIGDIDLNNLNLPIMGDAENGFYTVRNNEIDIELPSHLIGGNIEDPSLLNGKLNTWRGELQNYSLLNNKDNYQYWEDVRDNYRALGMDVTDGNWHKFRYDYHHDRVEFYMDDVLIETNYNFMYGWNSYNHPETAMKITIGLWFPSGGNKWAGPNANFSTETMLVKEIRFTNFQSENDKYLVKVGESFPFDGSTREISDNL